MCVPSGGVAKLHLSPSCAPYLHIPLPACALTSAERQWRFLGRLACQGRGHATVICRWQYCGSVLLMVIERLGTEFLLITNCGFYSARKLYRPRVSRLSARLVACIGCRVVTAAGPTPVNLGYLERNHYYFFEVSPQLSSRSWVDPVPNQPLLRKSGSAGESNPGTLDLKPGTLTARPHKLIAL
jgi:hypothetical protein